jgi:hypothetical protein
VSHHKSTLNPSQTIRWWSIPREYFGPESHVNQKNRYTGVSGD